MTGLLIASGSEFDFASLGIPDRSKEQLTMVRRRGLVRSAARTAGRTAVIAGTATAVSGRVAHRQEQNRVAQQPAFATPPHAGAEGDMVVRLQLLADLRGSGALTEKEFAAAKARLLEG